MTGIEAGPEPELSGDTARLDRIEARLAVLEDRVAGAGAAVPPPPEPAPVVASGKPEWLTQLNDFVRNNPVLALIGVIIVLVIASHILD
ncbi:hypothetical protein [Niveispirillum fermenti]|uniref:hypothetical protein n=1 Tax=Niveispirillum fermenti TaxID=1233113 RepID=UPI003A8A18B1